MARISIQVRKIDDAEKALPGFAKLWKALKAETDTRCRAPKGITFTDEPQRLCLNDGELCRRFALDLRTMALSGALHVSGGEWAAHGGSNNDSAIDEIPDGFAVLDCVWHDYYRYFSVTLTVRKGAIPQQLAA